MFNEKRSSMLHGVLLIALFSCAAFYIGEMSFVRSLSFSPMIVGIILGMLYANSLRNNLPETWVPGIQFCSKKILRIGIILYGFRLTFQDVLAIGLPAMLIDVIIVVVTICGGIYLGKLLKMDRGIALLTSIGSGICGAAAILGRQSLPHTRHLRRRILLRTERLRIRISQPAFRPPAPDQTGGTHGGIQPLDPARERPRSIQ